MQPLLSREQIREVDGQAIARGVPGLVLMENAGRGAAEVAIDMLAGGAAGATVQGKRVLVLCGGGNNGGDGYVLARQLRTRGVSVEVLSSSALADLRGDALAQARAWVAVAEGTAPTVATTEALGARLAQIDLVVDALLGTGGSRPVEGMLASWIERLSKSECPVLSLDVPSGLDADTGQVLGRAVRATRTATFAHFKRGLFTTAGHEHAGEIVLCDIGVPAEVFGAGRAPAAWLVEDRDVARCLGRRSAVAHKGSSGRVVVLAGSPGKVGAARLVARGALRAGAGLVTVAARDEAAQQLELSACEEMTARLGPNPEDTLEQLGADVYVVGPGLGLDAVALRIVEAALALPEPVVLDADALHLLARENVSALGAGPRVITPHPGEAARLLGISVQELEADRFGHAAKLAERFGAVVVLKGSRSIVVAPGAVPRVCAGGSPVLATGGTGDVLAGALGGLLVRRDALEAATAAVFVHARAGELCARAGGASRLLDRGILAREIADALPGALGEVCGAS